MKYPKRRQYEYAKQKKYRRRNWGTYTNALRRRGDLTMLVQGQRPAPALMRARCGLLIHARLLSRLFRGVR